MERFPSVVRRLVAAEQSCRLVHYYASLCDPSAVPETLASASFATSSDDERHDSHVYKVVYDVMRVREGRILFKQSYAERFAHSLALAAPTHVLPTDLAQLLQRPLQAYVETPDAWHDGVAEQNLKIVSWLPEASCDADSGSGSTAPIPAIFFLPKSSYPAETMYAEGAKLAFLYNAHRDNPNAKVAQTALRDRAAAYQRAHDVYETLLVHGREDHYLVPEGSRSNYLLQRRDGSWWCSAEEDILVGITLKTTYKVVEACGLGTVQHGKLTVKDVLECRALYMLGTSPTILPVHSVLLYTDEETRRCFEAAVEELGVDLCAAEGAASVRRLSESRAELVIAVDEELAPKLRAQYYVQAAAS